MKAKAFPPTASLSGERGHDDRAACRFFVELDCRGKHVDGERRPDPEVRVATVDSEPAEQQRGDGIGPPAGRSASGLATTTRLVALVATSTCAHDRDERPASVQPGDP